MESEEMSKLFSFLENFNTEKGIKIYDDVNGELLYSGKMGDVPQRISNMMSVVRGKTDIVDSVVIVRVRKC